MMTRQFTRRRVLAGLGAAGFLGLGWSVTAMRTPPYTKYTYAQTDEETNGMHLRVAWYETYNGEFQEAQNASTETNATRVLDPETDPEYVEEATGPVVTLGNVMPGDSGRVAVGLLAESVPEDYDGMDIWFNTELTADLENGVTEPERRDPQEDDPGGGTDSGELGDAIQTTLWMDTGVMDNGVVGACDGNFILGEPVIESGSLADAFAAVDDRDGQQVADCLSEGEHVCVGFEWSLPSDVGNRVQTDSVEFDLTFVGRSCGSGNPFASGGG